MSGVAGPDAKPGAAEVTVLAPGIAGSAGAAGTRSPRTGHESHETRVAHRDRAPALWRVLAMVSWIAPTKRRVPPGRARLAWTLALAGAAAVVAGFVLLAIGKPWLPHNRTTNVEAGFARAGTFVALLGFLPLFVAAFLGRSAGRRGPMVVATVLVVGALVPGLAMLAFNGHRFGPASGVLRDDDGKGWCIDEFLEARLLAFDGHNLTFDARNVRSRDLEARPTGIHVTTETGDWSFRGDSPWLAPDGVARLTWHEPPTEHWGLNKAQEDAEDKSSRWLTFIVSYEVRAGDAGSTDSMSCDLDRAQIPRDLTPQPA